MSIKKFNITKAGRKYKTADGIEKTAWETVGTYTEMEKPDGSISRFVDIPAIGLQASVFPFRDNNQQPTQPTPQISNDGSGLENIPF